jgi:hypothetical protein
MRHLDVLHVLHSWKLFALKCQLVTEVGAKMRGNLLATAIQVLSTDGCTFHEDEARDAHCARSKLLHVVTLVYT